MLARDLAGSSEAPGLDLRPYLRAVYRQRRLVAAAAIAAVVLALGYGLMRSRTWDASTRLLIDPRGLQVMDKDITPRASSADQGQAIVESEMRMLSSDVVLRAVIDRLKLDQDSEFNGTARTLLSPATDAVSLVKDMGRWLLGRPAPDQALPTLGNLQRAVKVKREPQSFVVDLGVRTEDGQKSARIANAISEAYLETRFTTQSTATQRASETMGGRLGDLRRQVEIAEENVERFKRENDIVGVSGRLVNEQQLTELNTQLVNARAETQKVTGRLDQIRRIRQSGLDPEGIDEVLRSEIVVRLRTQYASLKRREASLGTSLLPSHPQIKEVRREIAETRQSIAQEVARVADAAQLDLERARSNEQQLERSLTSLKNLAGSTNEKLVRLRELEREVEAARQVYATFLMRSRELGEQRRVDTSHVVTLATAIPPVSPTGVPLLFLGLAGLAAGLGLGVGGALLRDHMDEALHDIGQVEAITGERGTLVPGIGGSRSAADARRAGPLPSFVTTHPTSPASLAMRRLATDLIASASGETAIAVVTAAAPGEGKSTVAVNLALAAASGGSRVLLIDGDVDGRTLTDLIGSARRPGLSEVLLGTQVPEFAILPILPLGLDVLLAGSAGTRLPARAGRSLPAAMSRIARTYDLIVVDAGTLPHDRMLPSWARLADATLLVLRAGESTKPAAKDAVGILQTYPSQRVHGVLLS